MRKILIAFLRLIFLSSPNTIYSQNRIELTNESEIVLNNEIFKNGELSLSRFEKVNHDCKKYKTKRFKNPQVRYYRYYFKNCGVELISSNYYKKSDHCSEIIFYFDKRRSFNGELIILGKKINKSTKFDEIFYDENIESYIEKELNQYQTYLYKGLIEIRTKRAIVSIFFNSYGEGIRTVTIETY